MRNPDLWLLFVAAFAGFGGGIVLLNHVQKVKTDTPAHARLPPGSSRVGSVHNPCPWSSFKPVSQHSSSTTFKR
jgi:hypothetical protein